MYFCISVFVTLAHAASSLKSLNHEIKYKKKNWPTKYSREKKSDPRNTHEKKFRTREKILDPRNTHEKKFQTYEISTRKKFWTHEIPTRKYFRPTKYPREKILDPLNIHEGTVARLYEIHETHDSTRPTKFSTLKCAKF